MYYSKCQQENVNLLAELKILSRASQSVEQYVEERVGERAGVQDGGGRGLGEVAGLLNPASAKDGPRRSADVIGGGRG